jgi:hypothetical protein
LAERKKREVSRVAPTLNLSLEYPLGPPPVEAAFTVYPGTSSIPAAYEVQHISDFVVQNTAGNHSGYVDATNMGGHFDPFLAILGQDSSGPIDFGVTSSKGSSDGDAFLFDQQRLSISSDTEFPQGLFVSPFNTTVAL